MGRGVSAVLSPPRSLRLVAVEFVEPKVVGVRELSGSRSFVFRLVELRVQSVSVSRSYWLINQAEAATLSGSVRELIEISTGTPRALCSTLSRSVSPCHVQLSSFAVLGQAP